jgi:hypothetical protein
MMICFGGGELYGVALVLAIIAYLAVLIFVSGLIYQILKWWRVDMPFHLTLFRLLPVRPAVGKALLDSFLFASVEKEYGGLDFGGCFIFSLPTSHCPKWDRTAVGCLQVWRLTNQPVSLCRNRGPISVAALLAAVCISARAAWSSPI